MNKTFSWSDISCVFFYLQRNGCFAAKDRIQKIKLLRDTFNEKHIGYSLSLKAACDFVKHSLGEIDCLPTDYELVCKLHINIATSYYVLYNDKTGDFWGNNGGYTMYLPAARIFYNLQNVASLADCKGLTVLEIRKHE